MAYNTSSTKFVFYAISWLDVQLVYDVWVNIILLDTSLTH